MMLQDLLILGNLINRKFEVLKDWRFYFELSVVRIIGR